MWRSWFGPKARIVGIDLKPEARNWDDHGFEIHFGDQGGPAFWAETPPRIGKIDAFLDDGGHQFFQQIVTVAALIANCHNDSVIAVEDNYTSFMSDFSPHSANTFLEYAKDSTALTA